MSGPTKTHPTSRENKILVTISISEKEKRSLYLPLGSLSKLEAFLNENTDQVKK